MSLSELLAFEFMRNALAAGLLAAVPCGVVGTLIVVNRSVFLAEGIAHASFGGVGLALLFGASPLLGATAASLACALAVGHAALERRHRADAVIGVFMASSMALGVFCMDLAPGYRGDPLAFLFGSILAVSRADLAVMAALAAVILGAVLLLHRPMLAVSYDPEFARTRGVPVTAIWLLMHALIALGVILMVRLAGIILFLALVTIPPYLAERRVRSLAGMMALSAAISAAVTLAGLLLAARFNFQAGATVVLLAASLFLLDALARRLAGVRNRAVIP